ncbi:heterogeneous nuclear ribonucleoprotein L isoform X1 [Rhipicephalus sanguineus]|uniref:heterogeneous nuclear ribonucleoprotein L isoform X1 n=1 Tax=Rhipicephalus sanguineus TaxID=34632 RepID=UPI001896185F|nr:heterogeneous nuclear ribonucleoprotein L isoform X1 [Rhipicephalus sanguineus]
MMADIASYDGHAAKRQRTDEGRDRGYGNNQQQGYNYYNNQRGGGGRGQEEEKPNHVLLMTILNPAYPITVDVIHTICTPSGKVMRIVIFKKNGVQAMVEFDGVEAAVRAKKSLNGADIYSGCCTLKIEYAKPTRLNVYKNDNDSWDYTNPNLGKSGSERPALLGEPRGFGNYKDSIEAEYHHYPEGDGRGPASGPGYGPDRGDYDYGPRGGQYNSPGGGYNDGYGGPPNGPPQDRYGGPPHDGRDGPNYGMGAANASPQAAGPHQGSVLMVYGLNSEKMNAEKLFNLLCLYGNVVRIKFLKSKDGCAMVQMGDPLAVERAVGHLNNAQFFDSKMQLGYSKQAFLNDVQLPFELPDGTPSFKDFMGNRNNRFTNPEAASKNRIQPPSRVLHFFNTPFGITDDDLKKVYIKLFEDLGCPVPTTIKMFTSKTERSSSGLMEFETVSEAIEALIMSNHTPINNPNGKFPYILKLCFSSSGPRY